MEGQERIREEYLDGVPVIQIADDMDLSREAVYLHLREMWDWEELKREREEKRTRRTKDKYQEVYNMILEGEEPGEALKAVGGQYETFYRHFPEARKLVKERRSEPTASIVKDWNEGMTYDSIAKKYEKYRSDIQRRIKDFYGEEWEKAKKDRKKNIRANCRRRSLNT